MSEVSLKFIEKFRHKPAPSIIGKKKTVFMGRLTYKSSTVKALACGRGQGKEY